MGTGWEQSAQAWIASMGERGDWSREHVLDPAMLARVKARNFRRALDVGCGEGRFCRMLQAGGIRTTGIDPTRELLDQARRRDPAGDYRLASAEALPFDAASFDLVVSYLTLIDIADFRTAIGEMSRVLEPGGSLLIANLTGFTTACAEQGWIKDQDGRRLHYPVDRYLEELSAWLDWDGIRVVNWHRPLSAYMTALLDNGLQLAFFAEPEPASGDPARQAVYRRVPWFLVMEWRCPDAAASRG
jgi:SAM-dependent methyltransferase